MKSSVFLSTFVGALLALPAVASAQDQAWLRDRRYTEGPGYRAGDFELHPGAAVEFGYDSNYLRRAPDQDPLQSLRLRVTPSFSVSTIGQQRKEGGGPSTPPSVEFKGGVSLTYNEFIPLASGAPASSIRAQRNLGATADVGLVFFPGRSWSGALNLGYMRALTPTDQGVAFDASGNANQLAFNRSMPRGTAELVWTPGAGLFEWRIGYQFQGTIFENSEFSNLTNLNNAVITRGRWRFLPRTSLMYDASFGFINYTSPDQATDGGKLASHPMRARLGLNGLITPSFSILALVGWGASFYSTAPNVPSEDFDSVIGQLELKWFLTPNPAGNPNATTTTLSSIAVGFVRDFYDSYIGNYYERDRGYLAFSYFYGGKFLIVVDGGAAPIIYPQFRLRGQSTNRPGFTDIRFDASLFAEYRFKDQFGVNLSFRYNQNINKQHITVGTNTDDLSYRQIETYLGVRWLM